MRGCPQRWPDCTLSVCQKRNTVWLAAPGRFFPVCRKFAISIRETAVEAEHSLFMRSYLMLRSGRLLLRIFLLLLVSCTSLGVQAERPVLNIVVPPLEASAEDHARYFPQLLALALEKTRETHGPYTLSHYPIMLTAGRFLSELSRDGVVQVAWTMTSPEREQELLPIPISLLRGLNSHRIFLINASDRERFAAINHPDELRQLRAGQGAHWPDMEVLRANGYRVVGSADYELLFTMLANRRFDYFPRGLYEIWDELAKHPDSGLAIEETLMFHYHGPIYFFTSRQRPELAARIRKGLEIALEDGSFDELFLSFPGFERGYRELKNHNRRVFNLTHPGYEDVEPLTEYPD